MLESSIVVFFLTSCWSRDAITGPDEEASGIIWRFWTLSLKLWPHGLFPLARVSVFTCRKKSEAGFLVIRVLYQIFLVHLSKWWYYISPMLINRYGYVTGFEQWNMSRDMVYATLFVSSESQCKIGHALSLPWLMAILQTPAALWAWVLEWAW